MPACEIREIAYKIFSESLHNQAGRVSLPLVCDFEITRRCNLRCIHCYCPRKSSRDELSYRNICRILDEITDAGCLWLLLTGGEPLLRADFVEIYLYAKKKGLLVTLFTNATLMTEQIAGMLAEYPPFSVEVSLYGATKQTYERITGVKGSYERCMQGIDMLNHRGIYLELKTIVMKENKHEVLLMREIAKSRGLRFKFDAMINPRLDGSYEPCIHRLTPEEIVELDLLGSERKEAFQILYEDAFKFRYDQTMLYPCAKEMWSFNITSSGRLKYCLMVEEPSFDLCNNSFRDCWRAMVKKFQSFVAKKKSICASCDLYPLCPSCPGWSKLENDDAEIPVDYICRTTKLRDEVFKNKGIVPEKGEKHENKKALHEAASLQSQACA